MADSNGFYPESNGADVCTSIVDIIRHISGQLHTALPHLTTRYIPPREAVQLVSVCPAAPTTSSALAITVSLIWILGFDHAD